MDAKRKKSGFTPLEGPRPPDVRRGTQTKVSNRGSKRFLTGPVRKTPSNGAGFTLVEMLTVLGIIALLLGLLLPSLSMVRKIARETKQKAQLTTIGLALTAFRNDYGDYPPSDLPIVGGDYCGAQKLAEALLGWDLLGFHPKSDFRALGHVNDGGVYNSDNETNLRERRGPYLELATTNAFRIGISGPGMQNGLFANTGVLHPDRFVICDVFGVKPVIVGTKTVKAGAPILYYKANTSSKNITDEILDRRIYNVLDNYDLIALGRVTDGKPHPLGEPVAHPIWDSKYASFYNYIADRKVQAASLILWPYRPDSYILISAGADGLYGTGDDITNFGN